MNMDKEKKLHALQLLKQKEDDPKLTLKEIERLTGYSKMQLIRLSKEIKTKDMESILTHGNTGMKPKHAGEKCPDCGKCTLSFVQFQEYHGAKEEVDYCSNCGYIKFPI